VWGCNTVKRNLSCEGIKKKIQPSSGTEWAKGMSHYVTPSGDLGKLTRGHIIALKVYWCKNGRGPGSHGYQTRKD